MNKNHWEEVAKMLGVELGEDFQVLTKNGNAIFGEMFKFSKDGMSDSKNWVRGTLFGNILSGTYTIKKIPWKLKEGDWFWYIKLNGKIWNSRFCNQSTFDRLLYKSGNCFKTQKEAEQNATRIVAMLESDELFGNA